jgi:CheY-like chemotaxis protein
MTNELLSLRILAVSGAAPLRDWLRQGAASAAVPVEAIEADSAAAAREALGRGVDIAYIDAAPASADRTALVRDARAARKAPFVVLLAEAGAPAQEFDADALATRPARLEEARQLVERSIRVRLPSRVLIVDDSATMRRIVRKILGATRFPLEMSEAGEGLAALRQVRQGDFDIVFLDCNMPEFNGFETLAEIKREKRRVSVVMMTSTQDDALAERAHAQGATAFLKKPFYPSDIDVVMCRFYGLRALNPKRP